MIFYHSQIHVFTPGKLIKAGFLIVPLGGYEFLQAAVIERLGSVEIAVSLFSGVDRAAYRDGGLFHYHPAFDFLAGEDGIVLYPHFYSQVTLGWFDHKQPSRLADGRLLSDVLLLAPSPSFVAELPRGEIPDRRHFVSLAGRDDERIAAWEKTVEMSSRLGEQFLGVVETGQIRELVQRIE